jgi:hypothetical protein
VSAVAVAQPVCACARGYRGAHCERSDSCAGTLFLSGTGAQQCCDAGRYVDVTGECCAAGSALDRDGACCSVGVDACGICGGAGIGWDRNGALRVPTCADVL